MDDGKTWQNVTPPASTSWSRVTMIEASHFDSNEAYATVDRHQLHDFEPHIYRTRDLGQDVAGDHARPARRRLRARVKEDPVRRGLLFAGTERGRFVSFDDGDTWQSLQLNLPVTSVRDFEIHDNDLIVATHGRGFWVIDDISALRQINAAMTTADAFLFKPADAIAVVQGGDNGTPWQKDEPQAENAPVGAHRLLPEGGRAVRCARDPRRLGPCGPSISSDDPAPPAQPPQNVSVLWRARPNSVGGCRRPSLGLGSAADASARRQTRTRAVADADRHFTVRLTANGQSYTQPLVVKSDPRTR